MTRRRPFKGGAFEAIRTSAVALRKVDGISEAAMREFDAVRLVAGPTPWLRSGWDEAFRRMAAPDFDGDEWTW